MFQYVNVSTMMNT